MQPVTCHVCGTRVGVEKFSMEHTSVQWPGSGRDLCPRLTGNGDSALTCPALGSSIETALQEGTLEVTLRNEEPQHGRW